MFCCLFVCLFVVVFVVGYIDSQTFIVGFCIF